jgi:superfamily II DNA or RNA helicase
MEEDSYEYNIFIDETSPRSLQPEKIKLKLKPHQLAALYKAHKMEKHGIINYNITNRVDSFNILNNIYNNNQHDNISSNFNGKIEVSTNVGILGDIVGYGKTLTALSIIAASKLSELHINEKNLRSYNNEKSYSYFTSTCKNICIPELNKMINSTLVIVPRGPVYVQWEECIKKNTSLKYLCIENLNFIKKNLPIYDGTNNEEIYDYFNKFDIVLIKNTTLHVFFSYYIFNNNYNIVKNWKRIIVDEAHDIINKIPLLKYYYLWLISGTYTELSKKNYTTNNSLLYLVKDFLLEEHINLMLLKGKKDFVRKSFNIPVPIEKYYLCKLSVHLNAIKKFISPSILEKINANDISGAIKDLGGKNESENDMVELVSKEIKREISNKEREKEYIEGLDITPEVKALRLKNIEHDLNIQKNKLADLMERISELSKKTCSICLEFINSPIILECTHIYCGKCLMYWMNTNNISRCPECRNHINTDKMVAIVDDNKKNTNDIITTPEIYNKEDTFINIISNKPDGKFLVFTRVDNGFNKIITKMIEHNIKYEELKGTTSHMMNILEKFRNGLIKIILLNTQYAGSGIDINYATDVIIFHSMGLDKQQAIGRAQRVGRTEQLYIHNLCYEHEMPQEVHREVRNIDEYLR